MQKKPSPSPRDIPLTPNEEIGSFSMVGWDPNVNFGCGVEAPLLGLPVSPPEPEQTPKEPKPVRVEPTENGGQVQTFADGSRVWLDKNGGIYLITEAVAEYKVQIPLKPGDSQ